jgi:VWFA-related protein
MMKRLQTTLLVLLAPAFLLGPVCLTAQEPDETFSDAADVIEVEIPINIVAKNGEPIRGLTAEDFEILDQGKSQEITGFRVVDLDMIEPGASRTEAEAAVPPVARRHFLFLFDLSFSRPPAVLRAREAARKFVLDNLHPTDLAAVATQTVEGGTKLVVTFTPDRAQIARALDTLGAPRLLNLARRDPLRFLIEDPETTSMAATQELNDLSNVQQTNSLQQSVLAHLRVIGKEMAKQEKSFARGRVGSWSRSMGELAHYLDSIQGRKHVVLFSEGFDGRLLLGRQPNADDRDAVDDQQNILRGDHFLVDTDDLYGNTDLQSSFNHMLEEFRRADCVIQAVDISGLRADSSALTRVANTGQDALFYIANDTGGTLFEDANDFGDQLDKVLKRSSVTYLLSFEPSDVAYDGAYHRLKVKVDLPRGAKLASRAGYYAPRPYDQLHPLEKGLLASDAIANAAPSDDVKLNVLTAAFRAGDSEAYVPVIIEAEGKGLLQGHEAKELPVEVFAYVTTEYGEMKDFFTQRVSLDLSRSRQAFYETGLKYYGHLELPPGDYRVRVMARNAVTGRTGVTTVPLSVPAYATAEAVLLPPFFLESEGQWFLVREQLQTDYQKTVVYPFTVNGEPYVPAARPEFSTREEKQVCVVAYNLSSAEPKLDGTIVDDSGQVVQSVSLTGAERTVTGIDGLDKFLATFQPKGLSQGDYTLQVAVTDMGNGSSQTASIPFTVN